MSGYDFKWILFSFVIYRIDSEYQTKRTYIIIIIISLLQSTAGHRPLQLFATLSKHLEDIPIIATLGRRVGDRRAQLLAPVTLLPVTGL